MHRNSWVNTCTGKNHTHPRIHTQSPTPLPPTNTQSIYLSHYTCVHSWDTIKCVRTTSRGQVDGWRSRSAKRTGSRVSRTGHQVKLWKGSGRGGSRWVSGFRDKKKMGYYWACLKQDLKHWPLAPDCGLNSQGRKGTLPVVFAAWSFPRSLQAAYLHRPDFLSRGSIYLQAYTLHKRTACFPSLSLFMSLICLVYGRNIFALV